LAYDPLEKVKRSFKEVEPLSSSDMSSLEFYTLIRGLDNPPAYIVQILLLNVLGMANLGPGEKTRWETTFMYKGMRFSVKDQKFGWAIGCETKEDAARKYALEMQRKITQGAAYLDGILHPYLKRKMEKGEFFLKNEFGKLRGIYEFHKSRVMATSAALKASKASYEARKHTGDDFVKGAVRQLNKEFRYASELSNYSFATVMAFFSMQEYMLDSFYAFLKGGDGLLEFMERDRWREKFKAVFGPPSGKFLGPIYSALLKARETYRNPLSHGLADTLGIVVPLPRIGLVPLKVEYLSGTPHYGLSTIEEEDALAMVKAFDGFLRFTSERDPWRYYTLYLESGLPIPALKSDLAEIKAEMTSYSRFKDYVEHRVETAEAVANYDIT
jgi:hypothetical protein